MSAINWETESLGADTPRTGRYDTRHGLVDGEKRFAISFDHNAMEWVGTDFSTGKSVSGTYRQCAEWCWDQLPK